MSKPVEHKNRGRKPSGARAMTPAERAAASRFKRRYEQPTGVFSGKQIGVMLSGDAHGALLDLKEQFSDKSLKQIIDEALVHYAKSVTSHTS